MEPIQSSRLLRIIFGLVLFGSIGANALLVLDFKAWIDRGAALCEVSERALRDGSLRPEELGFAPFGFAGWHLYPYWITHEGRESPQIDGFNLYLRPDAVQVGQSYSRFLRRFPQFNFVAPTDLHNLIAVGRDRCLWFYPTAYFLLRHKSAQESPGPLRLGADLPRERFPLTEAEWAEMIGD